MGSNVLAATKNACNSFVTVGTPIVKDATVKSGSATYATVAVQGLLWVGRQVVSLGTATPEVDGTQVAPSTNNASTNATDDFATGMLAKLSLVAVTATDIAKAGVACVTSPVGLATIGVAVTDTAVEKGCDLVTHVSKRQVSPLARDFVKGVVAGGTYYVAGVTAVPALVSYVGYRVVSHYACQFFGIGKTKAA